jgi:AcrR family transcriptional regulator
MLVTMSTAIDHLTEDPLSRRPLRRDAERNRRRIIAAAREVFASRGLSAGLNDVAHHAGVGVGTVYRHFPNKDALIAAALQDRVEVMLAIAEEGLAAPIAWEGLTRVLRQFAAMHVADRGLRDVALGAGHGQQDMDALRSRIAPVVAQLLARAQEEGAVRPGISVADLLMILFMVTELARHSADVRPRAYHRYLDLFLDALRPGPGSTDLGTPLSDAEVEAIAQHWVIGGGRSNDPGARRHADP